MSTPVAKLLWGKLHFEYKGQGCAEAFDFLDPGTSGGLTSTENLAAILADGAKYRAALICKGSRLLAGEVGTHGTPPDAVSAFAGEYTGLKSGSTYKFNEPDTMNSCLLYNLTGDEGSRSSYWLRICADEDVADNASTIPGANLLLPPVGALVPPVYGDSKTDILKKWIEWILKYTVQGRKNPLFVSTVATPSILPYTYNAWRRAQYKKVVNRKMGRVYGTQAGHAKAFR